MSITLPKFQGWRFKDSLQFRIMGIVTILVIPILLYCGYQILKDIRSDIEEQVTQNTRSTLISQSEALSLPLWNFDDPQIDKIVRGLTNNPYYCGASVLNQKGEETKSIEINHDNQPQKSRTFTMSQDVYFTQNNEIQKIGSLNICVSTAHIDDFIMQELEEMSVSIIIAGLFIFLVIFISLELVLRPIQHLQSHMIKADLSPIHLKELLKIMR